MRPYTERETQFLRLAGLLGGYFVRRQFNEFIQRECGEVGQRFLARGLGLGHLRAISAQQTIYQVVSRAVYAALGDPDNRNRREHQQDTIRRRLLALDCAITFRTGVHLLSEQDRVSYLLGRGLQLDDLPTESFARGTKKAFVDRQPMLLHTSNQIQFFFIDEGLKSLSKWILFLRSHRTLLQKLTTAEVVFASTDVKRFGPAEALFRRAISGETAHGAIDVPRLVRYFSARRRLEEKRFDSFDQVSLNSLREDKHTFAGEDFESLYARWLANGDSELQTLRPFTVSFRTHLLTTRYEWLSPFRC